MSGWNKIGKKIILQPKMRNKVVYSLASHSLLVMMLDTNDFYILICGHLFFKLCVSERHSNGQNLPWCWMEHKNANMFRAWLAFQCLKRELEIGHCMLITLLHLLITFKFLGWTYLPLSCDATSFLILLSSCQIEFHVPSLENQGKWQTGWRFLFLSGILTQCL